MQLSRLLGPSHRATAKGWRNYCHKTCGDKRYRLGVLFRKRRYRCFNCGAHGDLAALLPGLKGAIVDEPTKPIQRPPASGLPWRLFSDEGAPGVLERAAIKYLHKRGIPHEEARRLGLGYGFKGRWLDRIIFPYVGAAGALCGWQGRLTRDPDEADETKKIIFSVRAEMPAGLVAQHPQHGMLYMIDRVPVGGPVLLVEGPIDAIHGWRACPAAAMFGAHLTEAQIRRVLSRRPSAVYLGLDVDKSGRRWNDALDAWEADPRPALARAIYQRTDAPVYIVEYPGTFRGDWGGLPDKTPQETSALKALLAGARLWVPGRWASSD